MVNPICPHCNAINATAELTEFLDCVRCGERFQPAVAEKSEAPRTIAASPPSSFLFSPVAVYLSFGLAALILVIGLGIVRPWEARPGPPAIKPPVVASPLGLSGLAYLPPSTNIVAAIQPLPLLAYAARTKTDPRKFLLEAGVPEQIFGILDRAKIPLDQIDHIVVGASVSSEVGKIIPGLTVCLKLTRPLADEENFLAQLKAEKNSQQSKGGRTVYSINASLPLLLTKVDAQTYLLGFSADDLAMIEKPAAAGGGHLPKELREAMMARIDPTSFVWVASDTDNWAEKPGVKLLALRPADKATFVRFAPGRAIAGGVSLEPEPTLRLAVRTSEEKIAAEAREFFREKVPPERTTVGGVEGWATVETPFETKDCGFKAMIGKLIPTK